jgi:hypothetical protein
MAHVAGHAGDLPGIVVPLMRRPIAFSPGNARLANVWLTTITGCAFGAIPGRQAADNRNLHHIEVLRTDHEEVRQRALELR